MLDRELGYMSVYLNYNSGRHFYTNGRELAALLESLVREWPVAVDDICLNGHSMGGLVARSACHYYKMAGHAWPALPKAMVFLGTLHHGGPLERGGNRM